MCVLDGDDLWRAAGEVHAIAEAAQKKCIPALDWLAKEVQVYTRKDRLKGASNIYQKVIRKRQESTPGSFGSRYNPEHITDGWGCRFVTLFQDDILQVSKGILDLICHKPTYHNSPFEKFGLKEISIYTNRPIGDDYSVSSLFLKDLEVYKSSFKDINWNEVVKAPENKKSAYSSVHFIVRVPVTIDGFDRTKSAPGALGRTALIEIQVRDIFEESWGEIQHRLIYSGKDVFNSASGGVEKDSVDALKILEGQKQKEIFWKPHIHSLKIFVDGCSQLSNNIYKLSVTSSGASTGNETQPTNPPESDKTAILNGLPRNTPAIIKEKIARAYDAIIESRSIPEDSETIIRFEAIIDLLQAAIDESVSYHGYEIGHRSLLYHLSMEKAFALSMVQVSNSNAERQKEIFDLYDSAIRAYPQDVTALYRRGWATHRAADHGGRGYRDAAAFLDRAVEALPYDVTFTRPHWLEIALPLTKGFLYWAQARLARPLPQGEQVLELLENAIAFNDQAKNLAFSDYFAKLAGLNDWRHKALSNEIYYLLDRYSAGSSDIFTAASEVQLAADVTDRLRKGLEALRTAPMSDYAEKNFQTRDTMLCCYRILNDVENVMLYANKNIAELSEKAMSRLGKTTSVMLSDSELKDVLQPNELKCYFTAWEALAWGRKLQG